MKKQSFFRLNNILKKNAHYNIIYGERSNGKTFSVLELALFGCHDDGINLNGYLDDGSQTAIIRRWDIDFKGDGGSELFNNFVNNEIKGNIIEQKTKGKWNSVYFRSSKWYLRRIDKNGNIEVDDTPFAYAFALNMDEHYKGLSYPKIKYILLDEFMTRKVYLTNEFVSFTSILSTIIRLRDDVKIFMCANSINVAYNPYFEEMGITHYKQQKQGEIDIYTYGTSGLKVAVEYAESISKKAPKKSNIYFAFDNPKLEMIRSGAWEMDLYPHLPFKYAPKDVMYMYFVKFTDVILQCEIININDCTFTFIHRKTTPIKEDEENLIYQDETNPKSNYRRNIKHPVTALEKLIYDFFRRDKVFYQSNEIGEYMRSYLQHCDEI